MSGDAPAVFLSYTHFDDENEFGRITEFGRRLARETRAQIGRELLVFQDRRSIAWGQAWRRCVDGALREVCCFVPVLTPSYVRSPECLREFEQFLARERALLRHDLILPVLYIDCFEAIDGEPEEVLAMCRELQSRQHEDWRELRFESLTSAVVGRALVSMARHFQRLTRTGVSPASSRAQLSDATSSENLASGAEGELSLQPVLAPTANFWQVRPGPGRPINDAIARAAPGDRIILAGGRYSECIVWRKPLEIVGDGPFGAVSICGEGESPTIEFHASLGRLSNVSLEQHRIQLVPTVDIARGRLLLEDCDISATLAPAVRIRNGADPTIRNNRIRDSGSGIVVSHGGRGTIEDNNICYHRIACMFICEGGSPVLRRNLIHHGQESGIYIYSDGSGLIENNEIFGNAHAGIATSDGGNPIVRNNRIHDNGTYAAIYVFRGGRGTFEDNDLRGNSQGAFQITDKCTPHVRKARNLEE